MLSSPNGPALVAYAITCMVLSVNLLFLWAYSGAMRARTKTAINPEDSERFGAALSEFDPPMVARVLRAHGNAQATIYPFLFLGLVFVLAGGSASIATIIFAIFTAARVAHSIAYLAGKQPWRTQAFIVGGLATIALMVALIWLLIAGKVGR
jgi:microsomal prostaglandin-E synthase 1